MAASVKTFRFERAVGAYVVAAAILALVIHYFTHR